MRVAYYRHDRSGDLLAIYTADNGAAWCSDPLHYADLSHDVNDIECDNKFDDWGPWTELTQEQIAQLVAQIWDATGSDEYPECPTLHDYSTGDYIRLATSEEQRASREAAVTDCGAGVIVVDGRSCYVVD